MNAAAGTVASVLVSMALAMALTGCASPHYFVNVPLAATTASTAAASPAYRMAALRPDRGDQVLLFLSFSGGGMRASALAFAVAEVLDDWHYGPAGQSTSLLQEVDIVTSVSGGSLFAAYLALRGAQEFRRFGEVMQADLSSKLLARLLSPRGLWAAGGSHYGRADLLQQLLDEEVFDQRTMADLAALGRRPLVSMRATDMSAGAAFDFTQQNFDRLCSDLGPMPIARAVAASMAVPVLLSPISIKSYGQACSAPPAGVALDRRAYVHLLDGGLVDNLGVRGPVDYIETAGGFVEAARRNGLHQLRRVAFVVVNSETAVDKPEDNDSRTPTALRSLAAWIDVPVSRHTQENLSLLRQRMASWQREVTSQPGLEDASFHYIEVNFRNAADSQALQRLNAIPTTLSINVDDLQLLRRHAREQLQSHPAFQSLVSALGAHPSRQVPDRSATSFPSTRGVPHE